MRVRTKSAIAAGVFAVGLSVVAPGRAGDAPKLAADYSVSEARESANGVSMTFSFVLRSTGETDMTVEKVVLADLGDVSTYATFDGGTLPARGELKRSAGVVVPASEFKRWTTTGATLFVVSRDVRGDTIRTRVDAYRSRSGR